MLWLLFFPNAPYILTDLQHLGHPKPGVPVWFDVLLLMWFAWTGLLLGMVSLFLMQDIVRREFGRITGWLFVFAVGILASLGIYIGQIPALEFMGPVLQSACALTEFSVLLRSPQSAIHCLHQRIFNFLYFLLHHHLCLRAVTSRTGPARSAGNCMKPLILLRGGGDLASGVALRLHRAGFQIVITELEKPLAVRRTCLIFRSGL